MPEWLSRTELLLGKERLEKLQQAHVLVAGLLLGLVYEVTKEPIARQEEAAKVAAYQAVFEDAAEFPPRDFAG